MTYDLPAIAELAKACAPEIATEALVPLVLTESGGNPLQVNVNRGPRVRAASIADAVAIVHRYMAKGYTVDVGLAQINSVNFARLGVTVEQVFEPCRNLGLASIILQQAYRRATRHFAGLDAISATYSLYNTGDLTHGFRNGYVQRVLGMAASLGLIQAPTPVGAAPAQATVTAIRSVVQPDREQWVVGQIAPGAVEVFR